MNISFPLSLRQFSLLPHFLERDNGESKKAHWVGNKPPAQPEQERNQRGQPVPPGKSAEPRAYRDLASITLGEVQAAYDFFEKQLLPSPFPGWVGTNMFSMFSLKQRSAAFRPPAIFGRVRTCHPSDGYLPNVQVTELLFPHKDASPDLILLYNEDINPSQPVQSYGLRVMFLASPEELEEFKPSENLFLAQGLIPQFSANYIELLHLREQDQETYPWFYVVGSRWLTSIPESVKPEVRETLKSLVAWHKQVFNYHPRSLTPEIRTLNWELEFSYNFTEHFLTTPETPADTVKILATAVNRILHKPIN
ncbi:MAG: hypothetical protein AB1649_13005 [Chloroflexota bacterium]